MLMSFFINTCCAEFEFCFIVKNSMILGLRVLNNFVLEVLDASQSDLFTKFAFSNDQIANFLNLINEKYRLEDASAKLTSN